MPITTIDKQQRTEALAEVGHLAASIEGAPEAELIEAYFRRPPNDDLRSSHAAMQCASLLREALWALVSEMYLSAPGADYDAYARQNFDRFDAALAVFRRKTTEA